MRKVYLHGALAEKYGPVFELDVATAGEAVRALGTNFPEIINDFRANDWHVVRGEDIDTGFSLEADDLNTFKLGTGDLHFVPHVAGSKRGGLLKIILGVALVGLGFFMGFSTPVLGTTAAGTPVAGLTYGNLAMVGFALALAGVASLLAPEEKSDEDKDSSFTFNGPGNAYEQGYPVPLVYGEVITGSVMVSGGMDVERIAVGV